MVGGGLAILISPLSRGINAVLHKVAEHLIATLDCVSTQASLNFRNLIVMLVADCAVSDFAGTA